MPTAARTGNRRLAVRRSAAPWRTSRRSPRPRSSSASLRGTPSRSGRSCADRGANGLSSGSAKSSSARSRRQVAGRRRKRVTPALGRRRERVVAQCDRRPRIARGAATSSHAGTAGLGAAIRVLPVVAGPVIEARIGARRQQRESAPHPRPRRSARPSLLCPSQPDRPSVRRGPAPAQQRCPAAGRDQSRDGPPARGRGHAPPRHRRPASAHRRSGNRGPVPRTSSSSATTVDDCARRRVALRAATGPIETWSSWLAARGDRVDRCGMGQHLVLRHQRSSRVLEEHHAAVQARVFDQERRQAGRMRINQLRDAPLADRAHLSHARSRACPSPARRARRGSCRPK